MIFEDPSRRRWKLTLLASAILLVVTATLVTLAVAGVLVPPRIPPLFAHGRFMRAEAAKMQPYVRKVYRQAELRHKPSRMLALERRRRERIIRRTAGKPLLLAPSSRIGFTMWDDPASTSSLERHLNDLDVVVPDWFTFTGNGSEVKAHVSQAMQRLLSRANVLVLPRLANFSDGDWQGGLAAKLFANDAQRANLVQGVVQRVLAVQADGVNVDVEALDPEASDDFLQFLVDLRKVLHAHNLRLTVDVPFNDPAYDLEFIGKVADATFVMGYDEHYPGSPPGPVASRDWFDDSVDAVRARIPADRLVVVIGAYGYDWTVGSGDPADSMSFRSTMTTARAADAKPVFEEDAENVHFAYRDDEGHKHEVWCEDALADYDQLTALQARGIDRIGLWRLGTEDATTWKFFAKGRGPIDPRELSTIPASSSVELVGNGEVLTIRSDPEAGQRDMDIDPDGHISSATYERVPSGFVTERRGGHPRQLVLTFDDGPDPEWTPQILDELHDLHVHATFFLVGDQAMRNANLVEREVDEGHLLGNHTFTHPHLERLTPHEAELELSSTERLIQGVTGRSTPFFRAPYDSDVDPDRPQDLAPLRVALQHGYVFVGANIDPEDWMRPGTSTIVHRIVSQVTAGDGQIILMHDAGGNRSQTVAAVPQVIKQLRRRGYTFVSLDKFLGLHAATIGRPAPFTERAMAFGDLSLAFARSWWWAIAAILFFTCTGLSIGRILFLGAMTLRQAREPTPDAPPGFEPLVSVVVPAMNEAKVIATTVTSILESDYKNLEVVVIDDGSTDGTSEVVDSITARDPRARCIRQKNGGKAAAANRGLVASRGEIVVAVDADTIVAPEAVSKLVRHFANPEVTAVCGNVEVGNVGGWLTKFQAIEYVTSQNFDRRAFSHLNCISVVPGALGAWRRDAVVAAGGYSHDTLTEDADLTLTMLRQGGRIVYEPEATGRTEAPESVRGLLQQRFRWTYGTYQCLWKHRRAFGRGTLGWIGIPNMLLFQLVFAALSPLGDVVMVLAIVTGDWKSFLAGYLAFLLMDVCGSVLAFALDHKPMRWLGWLLIQRFTYRQIMYYVSFRSMVAAMRGARHGWRKLERTGSVAAVSVAAVADAGE